MLIVRPISNPSEWRNHLKALALTSSTLPSEIYVDFSCPPSGSKVRAPGSKAILHVIYYAFHAIRDALMHSVPQRTRRTTFGTLSRPTQSTSPVPIRLKLRIICPSWRNETIIWAYGPSELGSRETQKNRRVRFRWPFWTKPLAVEEALPKLWSPRLP